MTRDARADPPPTVRGRLRVDCGLLVLTGLIVALASALLAAVWPLTVRTADEAMAESVRVAGPGASVVATLPQQSIDGDRRRYPDATTGSRWTSSSPRTRSPNGWRRWCTQRRLVQLLVLVGGRPGPETGPAAGLRRVADRAAGGDLGGGRSARVERRPRRGRHRPVTGGPAVAGAGRAVRAGRGRARRRAGRPTRPGGPVRAGRGRARQRHLLPGQPGRPGVAVARELLSPAVGTSDGVERTSVAALVSPEALPDLRLAVPTDQLTQRITFLPDPERVRWEQSSDLRRDVVELRARPGLDSGQTGWDGALDRVLGDASAQVASARGRAQVLLVGLLATTALTVVLAAQLLARRRAGPLTLARERGATLVGIGAELAIESALVAVAGAVVGVGVTAALLGSAAGDGCCPSSWWRSSPRRCSAPSRPAGPRVPVGCPPTAPLDVSPYDGDRCGAWCWRRGWSGGRPHVRRPAATRPGRGRPRPGRHAHRVGAGRRARAGPRPPAAGAPGAAEDGPLGGRLPFSVAARVAAGGLRALPLVVVVVAVAQLTFGSTLAADAAARPGVGSPARRRR